MVVRKARRILTMGADELLWRAKLEWIKLSERIAFQLGLYGWSPSEWRRRLCRNVDAQVAAAELATWWQRHMRNRQEPPFLLDTKTLSEAAELYGQIFPDRLESVVREAERVCDGIFSFLGINFRSNPTIDWQRDPYTSRDWPSKFYADVRIPFCDGTTNSRAPGDPKHVWELNRHEFLINCAKAYFLTQESPVRSTSVSDHDGLDR